MLNDIIFCSLASANIPSRLEPSGFYRAAKNRSDGVTISPWSKGRFMVWDATFCASAKEAGGAAALAEREKARKYAHLDWPYFSNHLR